MKKITKSIAVSGGASMTLGFFRLLFELYHYITGNQKKDKDGNVIEQRPVLTGKVVTLVSGGIVMLIPLLCGFSPAAIRDMLKSLKGDKYMRTRPRFGRFFWWLSGLRREFNRSALKIAKK